MSLVNDMLRDLEQRDRPDNAVNAVNQSAAGQGKVVFLLLLVVVVAVSAAGYFWWQLQSNKPAAPVLAEEPSAADPVQVVPDVVKAEVSESPSGALVSEVKWQALGNGGRLVLSLSEKVQQQVIEKNQSDLVIRLADTKLEQALPAVPEELLELVNITRVGDDIELAMVAAKPVTYITAVLNKPPRMVIDILPLPEALIAERPVNEPEEEHVPLGVPSDKEVRAEVAALITEDTTADTVTSNESEQADRTEPTEMVKADVKPPVVKQARKLLLTKNSADAVVMLQKEIAAEDGAGIEEVALLAGIQLAESQPAAARKTISAGLRKHPNAVPLLELEARSHLMQQQPWLALKSLQRATPAIQQYRSYYEVIANAQFQTRQYTKASQTYLKLLAEDQGQARWWLGLGLSLERLGRTAQARQAYQNGLRVPAADRSSKQLIRQRLQTLQ